jgi:D-inositol-3-phosphate glycosyltransferase
MKVLFLAPSAKTSQMLTGHSFIDEEILALQKAGVRPYLFSGALERNETRQGVPIVAPGSRLAAIPRVLIFAAASRRQIPSAAFQHPRELFHTLRLERAVAALTVRERIDLIHSHFGWPAGFGGMLAARVARVPLIVSFRGMDLLVREDLRHGLRQQSAYDAAVTRFASVATTTVYQSEFMRRAGIAAGASPERTEILRLGVDLARFSAQPDRTQLKRSLGVSGRLVLAVGQLKPLKGYDSLVTAMARLADLEWTLIICGEGASRADLVRRADALGISDRVRFPGLVPRDRIGAYFAAADVFVHTSLIEAAGNVVVEAQACGCPVVCTDAGGPGEYVADGDTGIVVPVGDPVALADAVRLILTDDERRARMSALAQAHARDRYDYSRMIEDLLRIYQRALSNAPSASRGGRDRIMSSSSPVALPR